MPTRLLVATTNLKKLKELEDLLFDLPIQWLLLKDFPSVHDVDEDGKTFQENAEKKAFGYAKQTGCLTLAEDSGLVVDHLKGEPGVHSARFSGPGKDDLKNCRKVLELLTGAPKEKRKAAFHCAMGLAEPSRVIAVIEEHVDGFVAGEMKGTSGFGYDPLFFYPDFGKTFGEVPPKMKHSVSHRGKALRRMKEFLNEYLKVGG
ncbi:MAG: RdgB/HAM1 family non-canonical purine NTP pyrophosphatase [Candidatus Omnitrophica bacterium]|nr:RdgB/HAM1 family non-canonical purine NTP pyrophosphatase [Candidatus Omnitrophota bacterium]